jgi:hypothetical protein
LRDPLAGDPTLIARAAGINPEGVRFNWKDYYALDSSLVLRRFQAAYAPPPGVTADLNDGVLTLSGTAPYEWITPARETAAKLPGIRAIADDKLQIVFPSEPVVKRFIDRFGLPDGMEAKMAKKNTLLLKGEATHRWLARVRTGAKSFPASRKSTIAR